MTLRGSSYTVSVAPLMSDPASEWVHLTIADVNGAPAHTTIMPADIEKVAAEVALAVERHETFARELQVKAAAARR